MAVRKRKRWQFCWCFADSPPKNGDSHDWRSKVIRCATLERAMDLMLNFVRGQPRECLVDYEVAALHTEYDPKRHDEHFHRIERGHTLAEYVD